MTSAGFELAEVEAAIEETLGLRLDLTGRTDLKRLLSTRLPNLGNPSLEDYAARLRAPASHAAELNQVGRALTVGETSFFREYAQIDAFVRDAIPRLVEQRGRGTTLRVLSAGSASGEEGYSLAIALREAGFDDCPVRIEGVDINPDAVEAARVASYSDWSLRNTPPRLQERYFTRDGKRLRLREDIRQSVRFTVENLLDPADSWLVPGSFDAIFCRNVLIYFSERKVQEAIRRFRLALAPAGYLFLGHSEMIRDGKSRFRPCHTTGAFYYQATERPSAGPPRRLTPAGPARPETCGESGDRDSATWVDVISGSARKLEALAARSVRELASSPNTIAPPSPLQEVLDLLMGERLAEAQARVDQAVASPGAAPELLLAQAALLTNSGRFSEAYQVCQRLVALTPPAPGAYYLLGLCCAYLGDNHEAVRLHRQAIDLDPRFALSHLQLGIVTRRQGAPKDARRSLGQAARLLPSLDQSTLLLFGGGFSRQALGRICDTELRLCEDRP